MNNLKLLCKCHTNLCKSTEELDALIPFMLLLLQVYNVDFNVKKEVLELSKMFYGKDELTHKQIDIFTKYAQLVDEYLSQRK